MPQELDLTPDPRVLQMLGEINLQQWRCLAELIDNSIDGFIHAARSNNRIESPEISVSVPTRDDETARVTIKDNGPGMSIDALENAVKAGWTGNDPLNNLGLFGMGFNISTARLGLVTEVWTTRAGDPEIVGVRIDLEHLRNTRTFRVPRQTRPKHDHASHGTEIVISRLKPDQRAYLSRANNLKTIRKHLARAYSSILSGSEAGHIKLKLNGIRVEPRRHCIWSRDRSVVLPDGTSVHAVEEIDVQLAPRRFCTFCMQTLQSGEASCPTGSTQCNVVEVPRRLWGWVGIQRYLDETDFGIDFVRNGRKIEVANKDLFIWSDGETSEVEYPIDDPRNRGRFVGEIHLDHCRVNYTKDRFERNDPSWQEMIRIVRGEGPLRPLAAKQRGYSDNTSPLYKLYQAFRRSSPQGKNGLWSRVMVVRDNERSKQMAEQFEVNDPDYITDERWWQLVEEQDRATLGEQIPPSDSGGPDTSSDVPSGFSDDVTPPQSVTEPHQVIEEPSPTPARRVLHELTRKYVHPTYRVEYEIQALAVSQADPELPAGTPWTLQLLDVATRTYGFLVNSDHEIFRSTTMTPLDGLLTELAARTVNFLKDQVQEATLSKVLADFRQHYCQESRLDPKELIALAISTLHEISRTVPERIAEGRGDAMFRELSSEEQVAITRAMAKRDVQNHREAITSGRFIEYADSQTLRNFFNRYPELFFDGQYWDDPYVGLDFGNDTVNAEARERVKFRYDQYFADAIWMCSQTPNDLERVDRDFLIRATCSLRLLRPDRAA